MIRFSGMALLFFLLVSAAGVTYADKVEIRVYKLSAAADSEMEIGSVTAEDTPYGLLLSPFLDELEPGPHGFHIHQNPDCCAKEKDGSMVPGLGAGGHYDPAGTGTHLGPYQDGHLGDLPVLWVGSDGKARTPVLAPRVKVSDLKGRSLMIHAEGDNYSDTPRKLGGGGARTACGVVP